MHCGHFCSVVNCLICVFFHCDFFVMSFVTVNDVEYKGSCCLIFGTNFFVSLFNCRLNCTCLFFFIFFILSYTNMLFRILVCVKSKGEILKNAGHFCP